jgi:hypothetical protein
MNLRNELKVDVILNRTLLSRVKKLVCLSLGALEPNPNIDMEIAGCWRRGGGHERLFGDNILSHSHHMNIR